MRGESIMPGSTYRIRVEGRISERWIGWFEDLQIRVCSDRGQMAATTLTGCMPDQAALLGLLQKLYTLGLPLLSVVRQDPRRGSVTRQPGGQNEGKTMRSENKGGLDDAECR
jgi:hypothetical protein